MIEGLAIGLVLGAAAAVIVVLWLRSLRSGGAKRTEIRSSVESMRAVGELVVLKVVTQQIVTQSDHMLGDWGEKWMKWLVSSKKTAMIFEFVVDFRYDLKNPQFGVETVGETTLKLTLPPCFYEIQLKDISFYDERAAALAPILLPDWLGQVFGGRFTEREKNELIQAARGRAESLAKALAGRMIGEVRTSAEATLRSIARSMGYETVEFRFSNAAPVQGEVDLSRIEKEAATALSRPG
jgi:hypothetical protein